MAQFEESRWADSEFSQNFRDEADVYLPFRRQFIEVTKSLYEYFIDANIDGVVKSPIYCVVAHFCSLGIPHV